MTKILIATPAYGEIFYTPYVESVLGLQRVFARRQWDWLFSAISYSEISESRNYLLTCWYDKSDATHILFIDADMGFEPEMIGDMVEFGKPVVGTIYPKRRIDVRRVATLAAKGKAIDRAIAQGHEFVFRAKQNGTPRIERGFMEVRGCGTGILLIERSCIDTMLRVLPEIEDRNVRNISPLAKELDRLIRAFDPMVEDGKRLSEDLSFCLRWCSFCGGEIWANIDREITHIGLCQFKARYLEAMEEPQVVNVGNAGVSGRLKVRSRR